MLVGRIYMLCFGGKVFPCLGTMLVAACAHAGSSTKPAPTPVAQRDTTPRFYHSKDYGTERQFNPVTEILNEGFDQLRNDFSNRRLSAPRYRAGAHDVIQSLLHPDSAMRAYGVWRSF